MKRSSQDWQLHLCDTDTENISLQETNSNIYLLFPPDTFMVIPFAASFSLLRAFERRTLQLHWRHAHWCWTLNIRGHQVRSWRAGVPTGFSSSNPIQTHLKQLIKVLLGVLRQVGAKLCRTPALQDQVWWPLLNTVELLFTVTVLCCFHRRGNFFNH